jgi:hypothetical protein
VRTPLQDKASPAFAKSWLSWALAAVNGQTPRRGAISALYAATDPWLQGAWEPAGGLDARGCLHAAWCASRCPQLRQRATRMPSRLPGAASAQLAASAAGTCHTLGFDRQAASSQSATGSSSSQPPAHPSIFTAARLPAAGRGGRYIGPNPLGLQLFGLAGSNTATRWPINWHLWLPHQRARLFDDTFRLLEPSLPASISRHGAGGLLARCTRQQQLTCSSTLLGC